MGCRENHCFFSCSLSGTTKLGVNGSRDRDRNYYAAGPINLLLGKQIIISNNNNILGQLTHGHLIPS